MILRDIIGHRRLTTLIARAIERESLPPTLLFAGPSGVGQVGRGARGGAGGQLPRAGRMPPDDRLAIDACGKCRACDRIARGVHVDVIALEPDERASIKIDLVREVLAEDRLPSVRRPRRVVLIREADTLEPAAQNSLLKSLEEPPPGTMFILTTAVPGALLPTVRSRCMRLRFGRLTAAEVAAALVRDHDYSDVEAREAAPLADGSIGQALALDRQRSDDVPRAGDGLLQHTRRPRRHAVARAGGCGPAHRADRRRSARAKTWRSCCG